VEVLRGSFVAVPLVLAVFDGNTMINTGQYMTDQVVARTPANVELISLDSVVIAVRWATEGATVVRLTVCQLHCSGRV